MPQWLKTLIVLPRIIWCLPQLVASLPEILGNLESKLTEDIRERERAALNREHGISQQVEAMRKFLKLTTDCHVDVALRQDVPHTVILIGSYNRQEYVRVAAINTEGFQHLVRLLKDMERYCEVRTIDAPRDVRCMIKEEMERYG